MPYNNTPIAPSKEVSGQVSLPLARVQKIINADPERLHTSKNAAFAIALATELFIQHLATTTHNVVKAETQKKPRRNVQYRDVAAAVAKTDNLEFLVDVVPRTVAYKEVKARQAKKKAEEAEREKEKQKGKGNEEGGDAEEGAEPAPPTRKEKQERQWNIIKQYMEMSGAKPVEATKGDAPAESGDKDGADAMDVDGAEDPSARQTHPAPVVQVEDSDPEDDGAAMQIEMEMRGPRTPKADDKAAAASPKVLGGSASKAAPAPAAAAPAPVPPVPAPAPAPAVNHRPTRSSTGGFTAINGK